MNSTTRKSGLSRAFSLGLSAAVIGGLSLIGATPAMAAPVTYSVSGLIQTQDVDGNNSFTAGVKIEDVNDAANTTLTNADGQFTLTGLVDGDYTLAFTLDGYTSDQEDVTVSGQDFHISRVIQLNEEWVAPPVVAPDPDIDVTNVVTKIEGTPVVGNTLTLSSVGWPAGTQLTYSWGYYMPNAYGDAIDGATGTTLTVTPDLIGMYISVVVIGNLEGHTETYSSAGLSTVTSTPKEKTAAAPVSSSTGLAAYLSSTGAGSQTQTSTGLPAGSLNPDKVYTPQVMWTSADSYVDVYIYSSPILVGTFPVVNGVAQITLSTTVLAQLAAGSHTLVVTGQTSGAVQSVSVSIAASLAATGFDAAVPVTLASILVLIGAALMSARFVLRRRSNQTT